MAGFGNEDVKIQRLVFPEHRRSVHGFVESIRTILRRFSLNAKVNKYLVRTCIPVSILQALLEAEQFLFHFKVGENHIGVVQVHVEVEELSGKK